MKTRMNTAFETIGGGHFVDKIGCNSVAICDFSTGVIGYGSSFFCALFYVNMVFLLHKLLVFG